MKTIENVCNRFGLTEKDLNRLSVEGILDLIQSSKRQLNVWSLTSFDRIKLNEDIACLEYLLEYASNKEN